MKFFGGEASDYVGYLMLCNMNGIFAFLNSKIISRMYIVSDNHPTKIVSTNIPTFNDWQFQELLDYYSTKGT